MICLFPICRLIAVSASGFHFESLLHKSCPCIIVSAFACVALTNTKQQQPDGWVIISEISLADGLTLF